MATIVLKRMSDFSGTRAEKTLNMVQLMGRVGQDPTTIGKENQYMKFSLATGNGRTDWHNVFVFRSDLVNIVNNNVSKGTRVMVVGSIQYSNFENSEGKKVYYTSIVPDDIIVLSSGKSFDDGFNPEKS